MPVNPSRQLRTFTTWCIATFLFWTFLLFASALFFIQNEWQSAEDLGKELGYTALRKDFVYRAWNADHGGVYAPVTEKTPPNPMLEHIPARDVQIQGKPYTLVNPAYMTRQVHAIGKELFGSLTHLTSLNVLHSVNKPDAWEVDALKRFEQGTKSFEELVEIDGEPYMRVMTPMVAEKFCLKCHAGQGYTEGDIRGGLSVAIPMKDILERKSEHILLGGILHAIIYAFGVIGLLIFFSINTRHFMDRERSENQRLEQQLLLQGIVDNISNGIAILSPLDQGDDFLLEKMNPAGLRTLEIREAEVVGKRLSLLFPALESMGLAEVFKRVFTTEVPEHHPASLYKDERLEIWLENYVFKLSTGELVAVFDNVTEQKVAEKMLLQKTNEWEKTFDAIPDIITLQDKERRILRANRAAFEFFSLQPSELIGSPCHKFFRSRSTPCPECPGSEAMRDSTSHSGVIYHKELGKCFQLNVAPVFEENGEVRHFVYVAKDITETMKLEQDLKQADKMQAIGTLAGGIAHDFNNILSAITGYAELADSELPDSNQVVKRDLGLIIQAAGRATELVKQILTFSRKTPLEKKPLRISLVIKEAMHMLRSSLPSTIEIRTEILSKDDMVLADPTSIHQVTVNLCTNALHAMKDQKGVLQVILRRKEVSAEQIAGQWEAKGGAYVVLTVEDSGNGMDPGTVQQIFDPYFTTKERGEGTGLGLATVHGIVKECDGFIEVESAVGKGTRFHVYLPVLKTELPFPVNKDKDGRLPVGNEHILVVDDEKPLCDIIRNQLTKLGYRVTASSESRQALELFLEDADGFDLVITDQTMPKLTGAELAQQMLDVRPDLPIILCTGYTSTINEQQALEIGIRRFLEKPITKKKMAATVREALDEK